MAPVRELVGCPEGSLPAAGGPAADHPTANLAAKKRPGTPARRFPGQRRFTNRCDYDSATACCWIAEVADLITHTDIDT